MVRIPLTNGGFALVDAEDAPTVAGVLWYAIRGKAKKTYAVSTVGAQLMHRLIMGSHRGEMVDHKNGDGLDNRRNNLRPCTHTQNMQNRAQNRFAKSPYKGVRQDKGRHKWVVDIKAHGKRIRRSGFATAEAAAQEYDKLALIHHGEFARLNFPHCTPKTVRDLNFTP